MRSALSNTEAPISCPAGADPPDRREIAMGGPGYLGLPDSRPAARSVPISPNDAGDSFPSIYREENRNDCLVLWKKGNLVPRVQ